VKRASPARPVEAAHAMRLPARAPFDAAPLFAFFAARAIPGVESADAVSYRRAARIGAAAGVIEIRADDGPRPGVIVGWTGAAPEPSAGFVARLERMFDLAADVRAVGAVLARDPALAARWPRRGIRVPGAWDPFEAAVRALLGQQVSVAAARTLAGRLVARCGTPLGRGARDGLTHHFPTPAQVAGANLDGLGLTGARTRALRTLACAVADGRVALRSDDGLDGFVARLCALPGFGAWSAHYIAMRALGERDAFPAGDLGVRRALATGARLPSEREVIARAERWRPFRAYAVLALWMGAAEPRRAAAAGVAGRGRTRSGATRAR
jgi:AraC family transcriptional regulator of adaptative response / DNA-3-methyladenine glycosylase II